jgi:ABC-type amino acid transport substrate-binding protein
MRRSASRPWPMTWRASVVAALLILTTSGWADADSSVLTLAPGVLRIVAQVPDDPQPLGIGFNKNNPELPAAVNGALSGMKQDGAYARLAHKWGVP